MLITIKNEKLSLSVETLGAQMMNLQTAKREYLWQGDPKYWADRSPNLFPFVGRLTNNSYQYHGKVYPMGIHGFAAACEFEVVEQTEDKLVLVLRNNEKTLQQYPFEFAFFITYKLTDNCLEVTFRVENNSQEVMPFGIGGHPGFRVPFVDGENFDDYRLEFAQECQPDRVGFTEKVYLSGQDARYPLAEDKYLPLSHQLFYGDAIILKNMCREVTLRSCVSGGAITVRYPDMPYLGIWHWPYTDAPYVCIEPWSSLPSRQDVVEEFSCKSDLIQLAPEKIYENCWTITVSEEEN